MTQPLFAACGVGRGCRTVLDCTGGLLGDALLLVGKGMVVECVERVSEVAERQRAMVEELGFPAGLSLVEGDARDTLKRVIERAERESSARPDVVYIDPMHPLRAKSALMKKGMRDLRGIVGNDDDAGELLALGILAAGRRVVVKWPRVGPGLETRLPAWWFERPEGKAPVKPSGSILGRATRWDVFTPRR